MKTMRNLVEIIRCGNAIVYNAAIQEEDVKKFLEEFYGKFIPKIGMNTEESAVILTTAGGSPRALSQLYPAFGMAGGLGSTLVIQGHNCSAGIYLLSSFPLEQRVAMPYSSFYHHRGKLSERTIMSSSIEDASYYASEGQAAIDWIHQQMADFEQRLVEDSKLTLEELRDLETTPSILTAQQAVDVGFVSRILV